MSGERRLTPEQIMRKLRDADAMQNSGQDKAVVLQSLGISNAKLFRRRKQYGGMKLGEADLQPKNCAIASEKNRVESGH